MACCSFLISVSISQDKVAGASGMFSILGSAGGFIAPFILGGIATIIGGNTAQNQFRAGMIGMLILAVVMYFVVTKGQPPKLEEQ